MSSLTFDQHNPLKVARNKFGFWSVVLLTINAIIGTGIFLSPAGVVKVAGVWTPLVYVLAGLFAGVLALTFAAAARYVSQNGSSFAYARVAFGDDLGFYVGVTRFVAGAIAWGVMATAVVTTVLGIFGGKQATTNTNITIGFVVLMGILLAINLAGTRITKWFNNVSTLGKVAALLVVIVAGLAILSTGENHFSELRELSKPDGSPLIPAMDTTIFVGAVLSAFYAYTGFESVATAASEMDRPERTLPRAIPLGVAAVTAIYVGVVGVTMVINPQGLLHSTEPVILASAFGNPIVRNLVILGAVLSMFGINVAASFSTPRIFDAMSRQKMVPAFISRTSSRGVPVAAFLLTAAVAIAIPMAFGYSMRGIMVISSVSRFIQFLVVPVAVIVFYLGRAKHRTNQTERHVLLDVVIPLIGLAASVFLMARFDWVGQFSSPDGGTNLWAVWAMVIGYVALPVALYIPWKLGAYQQSPKETA
ncbi:MULTISPECIES: APC family permease [unclassified Luteococcus]|uniref:APC family permease n=1 Tax=unclassified Luteococcus TaxID=2639923 RepID=UPI00313D31FB